MRLPLRIALVCAAVAVLTGSIAIGATALTTRSTTIPRFSPGAKIVPSSHLSVLKRSHAAATTSTQVAADFAGASTLTAHYQPNPAAAVSVASVGGRPVELVPANGAACLDVPDRNGAGVTITCEPTAAIAHGVLLEIEYATHSSDQAQLFGIAPDGVTSVTGTAVDGQTVTVPVRNNSYQLTLNGLRSLQIGNDKVPVGAPLGAP